MEILKDLKKRYQSFKVANPKVRIRDAARQLNVSEMQLLETYLGQSVLRLEGDWTEFFPHIIKMGHVMALTRNEFAVHERKGTYHNISFIKKHGMGLVVGEDIDLRLFMNQWVYGFSAKKEVSGTTLYSFQFFDQYGDAIHKIYSTPKSDLNTYYRLLEEYKSTNQEGITDVIPKIISNKNEIPDTFIDKDAFQTEWLALKDTHNFFSLVRKYKLSRKQALRLAPEGHSYQLGKSAIEEVLEGAADLDIPIMVFVNNKGCIQIHTGKVKKVFKMGEWFNIMDPLFNLHLNTEGIDDVWIVKKPTKDGIVTSIEVFDKEGELIMYCFGKRKPGIQELESWRNLIEEKVQSFII
ncbi:MAG: putative hemin transport protein [Maribacter sp.]|jgi:putative hemin transport protein